MSSHQSSSAVGWFRVKESLIFSLSGWIPRKPGILLRQLLYPQILAKMGRAVLVEHRVDLSGARQINLSDYTTLCRDSSIEVATANSQIFLGDRVSLNPRARLYATGRSQIVVQAGVVLDRGSDINAFDDSIIAIGKNTYIGCCACLHGSGSITIGENCTVGHHTSISANHQGLETLAKKLGVQGPLTRGIVIEDNCWLDTGVKILDGVRIGQGSVISAGAVVTKDIPPMSVVVGMPGEIVCTL